MVHDVHRNRLTRDEEKGEKGYGGREREIVYYRYSVTTRMTPALTD